MLLYRRTARAILRQRVLNDPLARERASRLTPRDFERLRDTLTERKYEDSSINQTLKLLSTVFNWGQRYGLGLVRNPLSLVERMPERSSPGHYSIREIECIVAHHACSPLMATAIYTGMRKGEMYGLRWPAISFDESYIKVERSYASSTKSGESRLIPIHSELLPYLYRWQKQCPVTPQQLVFPVLQRAGYGMGRSDDGAELVALLASVGITACHRPWHAFRHTFATLLCEAGASRDAIERLLGHTPSGNRMTAHYLHPSLAYLRRELHKLTIQPAAPIA
jgi:integrase